MSIMITRAGLQERINLDHMRWLSLVLRDMNPDMISICDTAVQHFYRKKVSSLQVQTQAFDADSQFSYK